MSKTILKKCEVGKRKYEGGRPHRGFPLSTFRFPTSREKLLELKCSDLRFRTSDFILHCNFCLNMWVWLVIRQAEVFKFKAENIFYFGVDS